MKIAIIGYSGSGKSTLAIKLAKKFDLPTLHFDRIQFLPNWEIRNDEEKLRLTEEFLNNNDSWVIDGNYTRFCFERRMQEADKIIFLSFNRFSCLYRTYKRYLKYKNTTRPDMAEGCNEKFDFEFAKWVFYKGRTKKIKKYYKSIVNQYRNKVTVIRNQKQLNKYIKTSLK